MSRLRRSGVTVKFQVGSSLHSNVNFARLEAERIAEETGQDVPVYHSVNGTKGLDIFTIKPKNRLTLVQS